MLIQNLNDYANAVYANNERFIQIRLGNDLYWEAPKSYASTSTLSYSNPLIPASGGTSTPILNCSSTWGYYEKTTGGGSVSSNYTVTYAFKDTAPSTWSIDSTTGVITATTMGTTTIAQTPVVVVATVVTSDGVKQIEATVTQAENTITALTGIVTVTKATCSGIPATGGTVSKYDSLEITVTGSKYGDKASVTFSSGSTTSGKFMFDIANASFVTYSDPITAPNLGATLRDSTKIGTLTATINLPIADSTGTSSFTQTVNVYQAKNQVESLSDFTYEYLFNWHSSYPNGTYDSLFLYPKGVENAVKVMQLHQTYTCTTGVTANVPRTYLGVVLDILDWDDETTTYYDQHMNESVNDAGEVWLSTTDVTDYVDEYYNDDIKGYLRVTNMTCATIHTSNNFRELYTKDYDGNFPYAFASYYHYGDVSIFGSGGTKTISEKGYIGSITFSSYGQGFTITGPDWISFSPAKYEDSYNYPSYSTKSLITTRKMPVTYTVAENTGLSRSYTVQVISTLGEKSSVLWITQNAPPIRLSATSIEIPSGTGTGPITLKRQYDPRTQKYYTTISGGSYVGGIRIYADNAWTSSSSVDWLKATASGDEGHSIVGIYASTVSDGQVGIITFTDSEDNTATLTVTSRVRSTSDKAVVLNYYAYTTGTSGSTIIQVTLSDGTTLNSSSLPITLTSTYAENGVSQTTATISTNVRYPSKRENYAKITLTGTNQYGNFETANVTVNVEGYESATVQVVCALTETS